MSGQKTSSWIPDTGTCLCVLITALLLSCQTHLAHGDRLSACFNSSQQSIDIVCGPGAMVRLLQAFYGYSPRNGGGQQDDGAGGGRCEYQPGDCILAEYESYPCLGRESCSINLPTGTYGSLIPSCGRYSNYFQVEYECVPAFATHDICSVPRLTAQNGYISTPRYPNNYHQGEQQCRTEIEVAPNQRILLHIIDMDLEPKGRTDCWDWMYFNDHFHTVTLCGRRANDTYKTLRNKLEIELKAGSNTNSKGFWLYYEAFPPPASTSSKSTPSDVSTSASVVSISDHSSAHFTPPGTPEEGLVTTPIPVYRVTPGVGRSSLPFAAIAGGVIGTLSVILIILLTLLVIKWYKERRYYEDKDEEFLDHRNPAFRSSGDFNACTVGPVDYYHC